VRVSIRSFPSLSQDLLTRADLHLLRDEYRGWSYRELGRRVGVSAALLCRIEKGERRIPPPLAARLIWALCVDGGDAPPREAAPTAPAP
jgi:hypothetical protein